MIDTSDLPAINKKLSDEGHDPDEFAHCILAGYDAGLIDFID